MNVSEIVSLQIGHYSNFVGSHWWNCQESSFIYDPKIAAQVPKEINHDVLYREGRTFKGEVTYTPRLVFFDLNNSLGSVKREGILYDVSGEENIKWQGDVTLHEASEAVKNPYLQDLEKEFMSQENEETDNNSYKKIEENEEILQTDQDHDGDPLTSDDPLKQENKEQFYQLDDDVQVWSDFLRTSLHSRSAHIVKEHQHNNPEQPFDVFGVGKQVLSTRESLDTMEDRIRFFTEECDHLQGFHILIDSHTAFGGLAVPVLTYLQDEYASKSRLSVSVTPARPPDETARERSCRIINSALSLHSCVETNSLHIPTCLASTLWKRVGSPLSFPHLQYKAHLDYHTSAILATALDTFSLPYRLVDNSFKMSDITSSFNFYGRKVAALNASLPLPVSGSCSLAQHLMNLGDADPWVSLTPHVTCVSAPSLQSCVVRGLPTDVTAANSNPKRGRLTNPAVPGSSPEEVIQLYLRETYPHAVNAGCVIRNGVKLDKSFPHIFQPNIGRDGYISTLARPSLCGVDSIPMMTSLQSTPDLHSYVGSLHQAASQMNIGRHQHFLQAGLDRDDFQEALQDLEDLDNCYTT